MNTQNRLLGFVISLLMLHKHKIEINQWCISFSYKAISTLSALISTIKFIHLSLRKLNIWKNKVFNFKWKVRHPTFFFLSHIKVRQPFEWNYFTLLTGTINALELKKEKILVVFSLYFQNQSYFADPRLYKWHNKTSEKKLQVNFSFCRLILSYMSCSEWS